MQEVLSFLDLEPVEMSDTETVHNPTRLPRSRMINNLRTTKSLRQIVRQILPESVRSVLKQEISRWNEKERPPLNPALKKTLTEQVWSNIRQLEGLLGVDLSRWAE